MNETAMLARVQQCLDARRDPLDDAEVVGFLDSHPEALALVAAMRADARALPELAALPAKHRRRWWLAPTAAAAVVALLLAWPRGVDTAVPRILAASLEEVRPRQHLAANYFVREPLIATASTVLETWQYRSEPR
jgi:hypothetical protein